MNDYEIASSAKIKRIEDIAGGLGIDRSELILCGDYIAKVHLNLLDRVRNNKIGKLVFVTAMTPTPHGEGKTTITIGLTDALNKLGLKTVGVLREPSLGPLFGVKGGATGGGFAQIVPMADVNLHFTGDIPCVESANNLLRALVDNHIYHSRSPRLDASRIAIRRVIDMNDRSLRKVKLKISENIEEETGFDITAASEVMAILCLSNDFAELKRKLSNIVVGYSTSGEPVLAQDIGGIGAMAIILRNAIHPNLVQTLKNNPVFVHGGPFANIAHGASSVVSINMALRLADFVITEGGFGTDLGGEKFFDIVTRCGGFEPSVAVIVASIRALKHHGNSDVRKGLENLEKHIENVETFGVPVVVALNHFADDTPSEISILRDFCERRKVRFAVSEAFERGEEGSLELAHEVEEATKEQKGKMRFLYTFDEPVRLRIEKIASKMYGASRVEYMDKALHDLDSIEKHGLSRNFISVAKTQLSLSDNPKLLNRPRDFTFTIREVRVLAGAGLLVPVSSNIMTMPGLPETPHALSMDIDDSGRIKGM